MDGQEGAARAVMLAKLRALEKGCSSLDEYPKEVDAQFGLL